MTVAELIRILQVAPQDAKVFINEEGSVEAFQELDWVDIEFGDLRDGDIVANAVVKLVR